jgi:hypothetical protein
MLSATVEVLAKYVDSKAFASAFVVFAALILAPPLLQI